MAEAVEAIKGAEMKVKAHAEVAKVFSEDLNSVGKLIAKGSGCAPSHR